MAARKPLDCSHCPVRDRAACSSLTEEQRDEFAYLGHRRKLRRGETLFHAGNGDSACATLISGALKISSSDADGVERILSLVHPAGFVGEMFARTPKHDVIALTESEVCVFPANQYEQAVERFPAFGHALLRRTADDLYASRWLIDLMGRRTALQKVAGFLKGMADAASASPGHCAERFELPLSRGDLAGMLGLTIETVSRQLTRLETQGAIRRDGKRGIEMTDVALIETLAG